jgi:ABC-type transport system substrate-binding protein
VRRALTLAGLVVGAALLLAAAGSPGGVKEGGTFRVGIVGLSSIDPVLGGVIAIDRATCASLVTFPDEPLPEGLRVVPEIALGYPKVTNAGKTYTFTIRKGFRFSTGARVTARSFAHTINRQLNPEMKSSLELDFESILGAQTVIAGKAQEAFGIVARGDTLRIRLRKPVGDLMKRLAFLCVVPEATPIDPEGVKAPVPGAGPYYIAEYVLGERVVLKRNPFYGGNRPRHVSSFVVDLSGDAATVLDRVDRGDLDYGWVPNSVYGERAPEFRRRYGVNKSRFFSVPANNLRMFALNASRPLFRNNVKLRQAVNFAVDRKALLRERGPLAGTLTDQFLPPGIPGFKDERIYPLDAPDVATARRLAKGRTRSGKAVLYVPTGPVGSAQGQILKDNLKKIGLEVDIVQFPAPVLFQKLQTPGEPFDIGWIGWLGISDNFFLNFLFDGRTIGEPGFGNWSYFNSRKYNRLLDAASRLPVGSERYRRYGELDVDIAKNAAPAIAFAYDNALTLVGPRTGCMIVNPELDLTAVCLK